MELSLPRNFHPAQTRSRTISAMPIKNGSMATTSKALKGMPLWRVGLRMV